MLARNAEALYWIGRYVERADDTARILDVTVHQLLEDSSVDPDHTSRVLLRVLDIEAQPRGRLLYRRRQLRGAGKREVCPRGDVHRDLGMPQHHVQRAGRT